MQKHQRQQKHTKRYRPGSIHMRSFKSELVAAVLVICVPLLGLSVSPLRVALATVQFTPQADLTSIQKQIVLRTLDGKPVSGITVQLTPADPGLGGPEVGSGSMQGITDEQGTVVFTGLGPWVWMASFSGVYEGRALQPRPEQGKSLHGRTRAGGGFPVIVQQQEEDAPATPVVVSGTPQPEVQPSLFVLFPVGDLWVPSLDLSLPGEQPQPLAEMPTAVAEGAAPEGGAPTEIAQTGTTAVSPTLTNGTGGGSTFENFVQWFYVLPIGVALFALARAWRERRHEERTSPSQTSEAPEEQIGEQL